MFYKVSSVAPAGGFMLRVGFQRTEELESLVSVRAAHSRLVENCPDRDDDACTALCADYR